MFCRFGHGGQQGKAMGYKQTLCRQYSLDDRLQAMQCPLKSTPGPDPINLRWKSRCGVTAAATCFPLFEPRLDRNHAQGLTWNGK
jgi:hypothetical protein